MQDLWTLKPENEKSLTKQMEQASKDTPDWNDRLTRFQNVVTYGLKPDSQPQDWLNAMSWLWFNIKELEKKHKNNRGAIEESHAAWIHIVKRHTELVAEITQLKERNAELESRVNNLEYWMVKNAGYDPEHDYSAE